MLDPKGAEKLAAFSKKAFPETITHCADHVYHVLGYGASNASFILADHSVILIDTLDTLSRGNTLRGIIARYTSLPVKTIIFTHGHPDHTHGAGAFADTLEKIIAFTPVTPPPGRMDKIAPELARRSVRQFGNNLDDAAFLSQGLGLRVGHRPEDVVHPLRPTHLYKEDNISLECDGVHLELQRAPGESDDQIAIWYEAERVLFSGDNYYASWPNLYALRGTPYRDVDRWIHTLDNLLTYEADCLLPGHTVPLIGADVVQATLQAYRDALNHVLEATLQGIAEGKSGEDLVQSITLPREMEDLPFLGEYYGRINWSVKGIYNGYLGWFDGNPTSLHPLSDRSRSEKLAELAGGYEKVRAAAEEALPNDPQWATELADILLNQNDDDTTARLLKAQALEALAEMETSANGRHYYLEYAKELRSGKVKK